MFAHVEVTTNERAEKLVAAVRARGNDPRDARDAAHEACHAIEAGCKRKWDREAIHRALKRGRSRIDLVLCEIVARAVEQLVCKELGVDCGTVEHWANNTWWETAKNERIQLPSVEWIAERVHGQMKGLRAKRRAREVLALIDAPAPRRRS